MARNVRIVLEVGPIIGEKARRLAKESGLTISRYFEKIVRENSRKKKLVASGPLPAATNRPA